MVRRTDVKDVINAGDHVVVPFGFRELEGLVIRVSETGLGRYVTVQLEIEGTDEPLVTTYRATDLTVVPAA